MSTLVEQEVLIVDCQTTGATPALGAVLELGWGIARPGSDAVEHLQAHWIALPEGQTVPPQVRRLTGFDEATGSPLLAPEQAWQRLRESMGSRSPMRAAIHFARFELAFLRDWASRFDRDAPFPLDAVCVHAIARRLYPDLPRRTLRALAGYLGYGLHLARRSRGHVEATAFIWRKLSAELAGRGVHEWEELAAFLSRPASTGPRSSKRRYPLPSARYRALPDAPGVYRLVRSNGEVLYVGKAASLRKRVASHFKGGFAKEQALEMLTQAGDIEVTLTPSALEAALLENESIKALCPPYNVQLVGSDRPAWFASERFDSASPIADEVFRFGPLPSEAALGALGALLALSSGAVATPALRAAAAGTAERWAPNEDAFAIAWSNFVARYLPASSGQNSSDRRYVLDAAKQLALLARTAVKPAEEPELDAVPAEESDPERVLRHVERNVGQAYQLLRRARWLRLLYDSAVIYREPGATDARVLVIRSGAIVAAREVPTDDRLEEISSGAAKRNARPAFDRAVYDRLRILTTELKRVRRDGGVVAVIVGRKRRIEGAVLDRILRWV